MFAGLLLLISTPHWAEPIAIRPSATDAAITQFNDPHLVYRDPSVPMRNELLIFLPGTNGKPGGTNRFCETAAQLGYHVVSLAYPTDIPATVVRNDADPEAFEKFRTEIIEGRDLSSHVEVDRTNSIEHRLISVLRYLAKSKAEEGWTGFLTAEGEVNWEKVVVTGHSQGGGHATLIGVKHRVARVVVTGAPKDFDRRRNAPAAWYRTPATPVSRFFAFNHELDKQGCDYAEQIANEKALGMVGPAVRVDGKKAPFEHSHMLFTNYEGSPTESRAAHVTVINDRATPKDEKGDPVFRAVWVYMLTEPVGDK